MTAFAAPRALSTSAPAPAASTASVTAPPAVGARAEQRPSRKRSVFTEPRGRDLVELVAEAVTAALCGIVTFAPGEAERRRARAPRPRSASDATSKGDVRPVEPAAAKAAFCIRGESECETGWPRSADERVVAVSTEPVARVVRNSLVGGEEVALSLLRAK